MPEMVEPFAGVEGSTAPEAVPLPSAPRSNTGYSLSQNIAPPAPADAPSSSGTPFHYKIFNNGQEIGYAHGNVKGGTATVNNIYTDTDMLGVQGLKSLREQVRQDFPKATNFEGYRISARVGVKRLIRTTETLLRQSRSPPCLLRSLAMALLTNRVSSDGQEKN
jgi:hypothetical protein